MSFDLPPIVKQAELVRSMVESAVASWNRHHRHAHGEELRRQAKDVVKCALFAWTDRANRASWMQQLSNAVDMLQADLRLAQQVKLYRSFGQFEAIMREAVDLGLQCGRMIKSARLKHSKGQSEAASSAASARPDTEYPGRLNGAKR